MVQRESVKESIHGHLGYIFGSSVRADYALKCIV